MRKETFTLSRNEWLVLEALWNAPATLMELVHTLGDATPFWSKSTTATMVRRMEEKGLIRHETDGKTKVFSPAMTREEAAVAETRTLLDKAFSGSVGLMVNTLVRQESLTRQDIDALYAILRQAEEQEGS